MEPTAANPTATDPAAATTSTTTAAAGTNPVTAATPADQTPDLPTQVILPMDDGKTLSVDIAAISTENTDEYYADLAHVKSPSGTNYVQMADAVAALAKNFNSIVALPPGTDPTKAVADLMAALKAGGGTLGAGTDATVQALANSDLGKYIIQSNAYRNVQQTQQMTAIVGDLLHGPLRLVDGAGATLDAAGYTISEGTKSFGFGISDEQAKAVGVAYAMAYAQSEILHPRKAEWYDNIWAQTEHVTDGLWHWLAVHCPIVNIFIQAAIDFCQDGFKDWNAAKAKATQDVKAYAAAPMMSAHDRLVKNLADSVDSTNRPEAADKLAATGTVAGVDVKPIAQAAKGGTGGVIRQNDGTWYTLKFDKGMPTTDVLNDPNTGKPLTESQRVGDKWRAAGQRFMPQSTAEAAAEVVAGALVLKKGGPLVVKAVKGTAQNVGNAGKAVINKGASVVSRLGMTPQQRAVMDARATVTKLETQHGELTNELKAAETKAESAGSWLDRQMAKLKVGDLKSRIAKIDTALDGAPKTGWFGKEIKGARPALKEAETALEQTGKGAQVVADSAKGVGGVAKVAEGAEEAAKVSKLAMLGRFAKFGSVAEWFGKGSQFLPEVAPFLKLIKFVKWIPVVGAVGAAAEVDFTPGEYADKVDGSALSYREQLYKDYITGRVSREKFEVYRRLQDNYLVTGLGGFVTAGIVEGGRDALQSQTLHKLLPAEVQKQLDIESMYRYLPGTMVDGVRGLVGGKLPARNEQIATPTDQDERDRRLKIVEQERSLMNIAGETTGVKYVNDLFDKGNGSTANMMMNPASALSVVANMQRVKEAVQAEPLPAQASVEMHPGIAAALIDPKTKKMVLSSKTAGVYVADDQANTPLPPDKLSAYIQSGQARVG